MKLTKKEQTAIDNFIAATKALPPSIAIAIDSFGEAPHLRISKRDPDDDCCATEVASITKASLIFG